MYTASLTIDHVIPKTTIALASEVNVRQLIEMAFVQLQSGNLLDPFRFTIDYFGYDYFEGNTSYLGYGIVGINDYVSNDQNYWELCIGGRPSKKGMDSYFVRANDDVELKWLPVSAGTESAAARIHSAMLRRTK
jgi:hypothetical protein